MKKKRLHYNTITPLLHEVLKTVMSAPEFNAFRLVGGTALSLYRGHRESADIDMFTDAAYNSIDFNSIDTFLRGKYPYVDTNSVGIVGMGKSYFVGNDKDNCIKLDVFYTNDAYMQDAIVIDGIRMATIEEIIAMKLDVISGGGRKKDFWDIHELKDDYTLMQMLELYKNRHPYTYNINLVKRKFEDFSKADREADPVCLKNKEWGLIELDIIDFVWADSPVTLKKAHYPIRLNTVDTYRLQVKGGVDYINTLLYFRYNDLLQDKQVLLTLRNNSGEKLSIPVHFAATGQTSFFLVSEADDLINDYTFPYLEFSSKEDMLFDFWVEDPEGGFT